MDKLRDLIYNKNDLLVAVVILLVAGIVIFSKINVIMAFSPEGQKSTVVDVAGTDGSGAEAGGAGDGSEGAQAGADASGASSETAGTVEPSGNSGASDTVSNKGTGAGGQEIYPYSVYISPGQTVAEIGKIMVDLGLFSTTAEFIKLVEDKGLSSKMQTGTFIIPQNASHDEVVKILTKPGL